MASEISESSFYEELFIVCCCFGGRFWYGQVVSGLLGWGGYGGDCPRGLPPPTPKSWLTSWLKQAQHGFQYPCGVYNVCTLIKLLPYDICRTNRDNIIYIIRVHPLYNAYSEQISAICNSQTYIVYLYIHLQIVYCIIYDSLSRIISYTICIPVHMYVYTMYTRCLIYALGILYIQHRVYVYTICTIYTTCMIYNQMKLVTLYTLYTPISTTDTNHAIPNKQHGQCKTAPYNHNNRRDNHKSINRTTKRNRQPQCQRHTNLLPRPQLTHTTHRDNI